MIDITEQLANPTVYPWGPDSVQRIDTHLSHVFLAGERVLKIKRAVDYGFVDFRSLEARRQSCEDESRLNARLTTGVYLGAVPITLADGIIKIDGAGEIVEWGTVMRRLPADGMLDERIRHGDVPPAFGNQLGTRLVAFHQSIAGTCYVRSGYGSDSSTAVVLENLEQLAPFSGPVLDERQFGMVAASICDYIAGNRAALDRRVADGWIREGHGDLRAEHICGESGGMIQIFDCVEFSKEIRCADVASDLAFLLMDLRRLKRPDLAADITSSYHDAGIKLPKDLLRLYEAHRALVRAKVACLSMSDTSDESASRHRQEASEYLNLATAATVSTRPVLIAMTGLSGTGKSTVAHAIAQAMGATVIASDAIRKQLAGGKGSASTEWRTGIYSPDWTDRTYARLLDEAQAELRAGKAVVVDATFLDDRWRIEAAVRARNAQASVLFIHVTCDPAVAERRIRARASGGASVSDASVDTFREQVSVLRDKPVRFPDGSDSITVDTSKDGPVRIGRVLQELIKIGQLTPGIGA
jgi:uncharacterized protein